MIFFFRRSLNRFATLIQTYWRAHQARASFRQTLKEHVIQLRLKYYDDNAVKVRRIYSIYTMETTKKLVLDSENLAWILCTKICFGFL